MMVNRPRGWELLCVRLGGLWDPWSEATPLIVTAPLGLKLSGKVKALTSPKKVALAFSGRSGSQVGGARDPSQGP